MKLSTMFKVYRYANAFAGFGLPGLVMEAAKASIKKEVAFQMANLTPIPESETRPEIDFFTVVYRNHTEK
jgi:hypothetical protein|nr:MAG TPA: hypothetical protein [Caudoviricetes sp.]